MLSGLGRLIDRRRWTSLALIIAMTCVSAVWGLGVFAKFTEGGFEDPDASSTLVAKLGATYFGSTNPDVLVLYSSDTMTVDDPRYQQSVVTTIARLPKANVEEIISYWSFDGEAAQAFASHDRTSTFVAVKLQGDDGETLMANYHAIKEKLAAPGLTTEYGGAIPLGEEFGQQVVNDIIRAELITAGPLFLLLIILFGALGASFLPLFVAIFAMVGGLAVLHLVTYMTDVTSFALEVVTMMGVGLSIDYSLFIISRFREELERGMAAHGIPPGKPWKKEPDRRSRKAAKKAHRAAIRPLQRTALMTTMATAGRTIVVSGITVSAALAGLMLFPQMFLQTIGLAGIATVMVAVFGATVLLPTMLALMGPRIEFGQMPWKRASAKRANRSPESGFWYRLGQSVMKHPLPYFAIVLVVLGVLSQPLMNIQFGSVDARTLPADSPTRAVVETVKEDFPAGSAEPIDVVVSGDLIPRDWTPSGNDPIPPYLDEFREQLGALPGVVESQFTGYSGTYGGVRISVTHEHDPMDQRAQDLVTEIRGMHLAKDGQPMHIDVGGSTAAQMDLMSSLMENLPKMALFVGGVTFLLLFMFFGSIVLPLKAIAMNVLSIGASFGVIVWGFQYGHLAGLLNFTPTGGVEATSMILILAVVFGLSMDYEVFLLSRIREEWDLTHDNRKAVARGMQHTGSIITSAALLFLVVIAAFSTAGITVVKLIGVGMFVGIVIDAALVRSLLVPATMRFMGRANWWLPPFLAGLHAKMDLRERSMPLAEAGPAVAPRLPAEQPFPYALHWTKAAPAEEDPPSGAGPPRPAANDGHAPPRPPYPEPAPRRFDPPNGGPARQGPPGGHGTPRSRPAGPAPGRLPSARPYADPQEAPAPVTGPTGRPIVDDGFGAQPPRVVFRTPPGSETPPRDAENGGPRSPWADDPPQGPPPQGPPPQSPPPQGPPAGPPPARRTRREIIPNPDGTGWRWGEAADDDPPA